MAPRFSWSASCQPQGHRAKKARDTLVNKWEGYASLVQKERGPINDRGPKLLQKVPSKKCCLAASNFCRGYKRNTIQRRSFLAYSSDKGDTPGSAVLQGAELVLQLLRKPGWPSSDAVCPWNSLSGFSFQFGCFLCERRFPLCFCLVFQRRAWLRSWFRFLNVGSGDSSSAVGSWNAAPTVPVSGSGSVATPSWKGTLYIYIHA